MLEVLDILPYDGEVILYPSFVSDDESLVVFNTLLNEVPWVSDELMMFGKLITTSRKVAWYGDEGKVYTYSGKQKRPLSWSPELTKIKRLVEKATGFEFNSCLLNLYHNGEEGMGWHADNEPELGNQPVIASLSLGATRKFSLKHNTTGEKVDIILESGSLLIMKGKLQHCWKHALPKSQKVKSPRINLTFRQIKR